MRQTSTGGGGFPSRAVAVPAGPGGPAVPQPVPEPPADGLDGAHRTCWLCLGDCCRPAEGPLMALLAGLGLPKGSIECCPGHSSRLATISETQRNLLPENGRAAQGEGGYGRGWADVPVPVDPGAESVIVPAQVGRPRARWCESCKGDRFEAWRTGTPAIGALPNGGACARSVREVGDSFAENHRLGRPGQDRGGRGTPSVRPRSVPGPNRDRTPRHGVPRGFTRPVHRGRRRP